MANGRNEVTLTVSDLEQLCRGPRKDRSLMLDYFKKRAGHNGHSNYQTWHTLLYICNDKHIFSAWEDCAQALLREQERKVSGLFLTPYEAARNQLRETLRDYFKQKASFNHLDQNSQAILMNGYASVDWFEIAETLMEPLKCTMRGK